MLCHPAPTLDRQLFRIDVFFDFRFNVFNILTLLNFLLQHTTLDPLNPLNPLNLLCTAYPPCPRCLWTNEITFPALLSQLSSSITLVLALLPRSRRIC